MLEATAASASTVAPPEAPRREHPAVQPAVAKPSPLEAMRAARPQGARPAVVQPKRSQLSKSLLHLTRRGHLYAGLLLLPWVFLYGVTGFLFNHPEFWPDTPIISINRSHTQGTEIASLPRASEIAASVVAALNAQGGEQYTLLDPDKIQFGRGGMGAVLSNDGKPFSVSLLSNGTGSIREGFGRGGGGGGGGGGGPTPQGAAPQGGSPAGQSNAAMAAGMGEREGGRESGEARRRGGFRGERGPSRDGAALFAGSDGPVSAIDDLNASASGDGPRPEGGRRRSRGGPREGGEERAGGEMAAGRGEGPGPGRGGRPEGSAEMGERRGGAPGTGFPGAEDTGPPAPFAVAAGFVLPQDPAEQIRKGLPTVLERLDMKSATISSVRMTPLTFTIEGAGKKWRTTYNPEQGSVSGRAIEERNESAATMTFRRFLLRMHTAHGYPAEDVNLRWVWALLVDATSIVMVFWGISGIVMWWQIKRTRWLGGACLLVSTVAATYIAIGMHEMMTAAGGR